MERHIRVSQLISIVFTKPDNVYSNRFSELIPLSSRGIKYTRPEVESIPIKRSPIEKIKNHIINSIGENVRLSLERVKAGMSSPFLSLVTLQPLLPLRSYVVSYCWNSSFFEDGSYQSAVERVKRKYSPRIRKKYLGLAVDT